MAYVDPSLLVECRVIDVGASDTFFSHHLFYLTLEDQMLLAPIDKPRNVLDIGTGAGLWPMFVIFMPLQFEFQC